MNKTLLMTAALLATSVAWAEWVPVAPNEEYVIYVDPSTIRKNGNLTRYWELTSLKKANQFGWSNRVLQEVNCWEGKRRSLQNTFYSEPMGEGSRVGPEDGEKPWRFLAPGTNGDRVLKFVCER